MRRACALACAAALTMACGGGSPASPSSSSGSSSGGNNPFGLPGGTIAFHSSPIAPETIRYITPLGNLNPPGHSTPSDHIYFYFANPDAGETPEARRTAVFVPAGGTVSFLIGGQGAESKVMVAVTSTMWYYLDHVIPEIPVAVGTVVSAGQRLGTTGLAYAMDLGVINSGVTPAGIISPSRYGDETNHGDAPLKYFDEPVRSQLYGKVQRIGADLDGRFAFDVAGRLAGNWFLENNGSAIAMSFAYNTYDPSQVRLGIGGTPITGVFAIGAGEPDPAGVSVATGLVRYTITTSRTGPPIVGNTPLGTLLVQMLTDSRIEVEAFVGSLSATSFTGNARFFIR